jgi:hypothetical protein
MSADLSLTLPAPERAQHIVDALRKGIPPLVIGKQLDPKRPYNPLPIIKRIAADVNNYDTDVDEVAVQRAYEGDKGAWVGLTHYERRACLNRLLDRGLAGPGHVRWPELPAVEAGKTELGWLDYWCEAVGEDQFRFRKMLNRRRNAA